MDESKVTSLFDLPKPDLISKVADDPDYVPFRWSFSQWENYNGCPARWKYKSILKVPGSGPGPHAARGLDMHDRCEKYIKKEIDVDTLIHGDITMRFGDLKPAVVHPKYIPVLDSYRDHDANVMWTEYKLGMDEEWYLCAPRSRLSSCLMVLDVIKAKDGIVDVGEWKSGKPKDSHGDQRMLYALGAIKAWLADEVRVTTYYLEDTAPPNRLVVKSSAEEKLKDLWRGRVETMQGDQICAPRPGYYCRWCDYAASKGGPCQFS